MGSLVNLGADLHYNRPYNWTIVVAIRIHSNVPYQWKINHKYDFFFAVPFFNLPLFSGRW